MGGGVRHVGRLSYPVLQCYTGVGLGDTGQSPRPYSARWRCVPNRDHQGRRSDVAPSTGHAGAAGHRRAGADTQAAAVENRGKVASGREVSAPTYRFARALLQEGAQSHLQKSKISSHGRAVTCRSGTRANLPFCARKRGTPRESIEGALCARASSALV